MYIGGMLNFATTRTYWMKIAVLAVVLLIEAGLDHIGLPLVPWVIFRVPQNGWLAKLARPRPQNNG
jgi:hypothetical protein